MSSNNLKTTTEDLWIITNDGVLARESGAVRQICYHDRHQAPHYPPVYYGEQQDQGRESSYWTLPGSRTGGALQEYTNWTEPELPALTSSHFPFILDRHTQQHQDLGEYQAQEARDREWTAAQRATREYERGFLREGWQRKWEPCSPVRYNREVSKRTDSSYRELEAWAARYSHSLPRRRRIEAELRGASQGLLERSRDSRSGTDPRATTLQQVMQSANIRESGLWDRGVRQQAQTYYPPQVPAPVTSRVLDIKENTGYQRKMFSQPPGYIAPPPYNSPPKSPPVTHHCDISWEQEGKRQTYWSQATLRKQGMYDKKNREKEDSQKTEGNQKTSELEGLKHQTQETVAVQPGSPISIQHRQIQHECLLPLQQPQTIQAVQSTKINEETSSKVIEGRKFRLNKKTGGLTIFCLVSRIAGTTETPSLPICTSQTIIQSTELGGQVSTDLRNSSDINQTLADEIDFRVKTLTEQSNTQPSGASNLKAKQMETSTCVESETLVVNLSNEDEIDVSPDSTFGKQVALSVPPMSVKYPLWREPSFTSKVNSEEGASEDCAGDNNHPTDVEVTRLDIKKDIESDTKGLLVIDTTCVVKMEVIPSPKKEHVYFLDSTAHTELSPLDIESTSQLNQDVAIEQNAETKFLQINESPETELDSDLVDKTLLEVASEISFLPSSPVFERETLEERAERILGISLHDYHTQQQSEEATSLLELHVEGQDERVESSQMKNNDVNDEDDTKEGEQPQNLLELDQNEDAVCLRKDDDAKDLVTNEGGEDFTETNVDCQSRTDTNSVQEVEMIEDSLLESSSEEGASEQVQEKSPSTDFSNSSSPSPTLDCEEPIPALALMLPPSDITSLSCISESTTEEGPDPELTALDSAVNLAPQPETLSLPQTPSQQLASPLPPGSTEPSSCSTPHTDNFPPPPVDLIVPTAEAISTTNLCVEDQVEEEQISELMENEISDVPGDFAKDIAEELVSQQQFECGQSKEVACITESDMTEDKLPKDVNEHPTVLLEQTPKLFTKEHPVEFNILQQQCVQAEDNTCVKKTEETLQKDVQEDATELLEQTPEICEENVTDSQTEIEAKILQQQFDYGHAEDAFCEKDAEEQSQKEENTDPTDLLEQRPEISEENATGSQTEIEAKILQQQFDYGRADDAFCEKEPEEPPQKDDDVDPVGLLEETISKEDATDCQAQREILQDIAPLTELSNSSPLSPSDSDCEVSQISLDDFSQSQLLSLQHTSHKSSAEFVSLLEMASVCPSTLNPDTGVAEITEIVPPPLLLESCDESLQFSSSCLSESVQVLPPSSSTQPPEKESGNIFPDLPMKEESQYPKSLWDAVNRIRKHTAPDSENEEEEVCELWDPESVGEDLGHPDAVAELNSEDVTSYCSNNTTGEKEVFDEAGHQEVSEEGHVEDTEVGQVEQDQCHEEPTEHAEEDTLSCSSTSSHDSGDTVIVADEDEAEEISDVVTESKTETDGEFPTTEGEQCCSKEIQEETAAEEDGDGHETECYQIEECPGEVKNMTMEAVEMMEAEPKQKKEVFTSSEINVVSDEITG
ncbi:hypothetical protein PAMP_017211 [Pampus punctatissimus]